MNCFRSVVGLSALAFAGIAAAQSTDSFEFERLQLDPAARGSLVVGTGEVAPAGSFRVSVSGEREHLPLVVVGGDDVLGRRDNGSAEALVKDRDTLHLTADVVLLPRLELYARGNFILSQGDGITAASADWAAPSFGLRLGVLQQSSGAPLNVAIAGEFFPAWGTAGLFAKPNDAGALGRLELGRTFGKVVVGLDGAYAYQDKQLIGTREMGSEVRWGAVVAGTGTVAPELSYRGAFGVEGDTGPATSELLAGVRARFGWVEVFGLGGPGFFNRYGTPQWRALVGFGLRNDRVTKAAAPAPAPEPAAAPAAPPPPPPDPCAPGQTHTPAQCPALDDDADGIANADDACPTEKGIAELKGCPAKDSDKDGIPDHLDKCPAEAGVAEQQGCPRVTIAPETKKIELHEKVAFDTGKATIKAESNPLLDDVAKVLNDHPEITRVVVEGHTDATGSAALNRRLSQARAEAVAKALVARGVDKARLAAKGFGSSRPIASNDTPEGRDANRRVEISIAAMK